MRRKPAELRAITGDLSHRPARNTPKAAPLLADPPDSLGPRGVEMWERVRDAFPGAPVVQESDYSALLVLCESWELAQAAHDDISARGVVVASIRTDREPLRNPSIMVYNASMDRVVKLLGQFGLTPLDRARFDVPGANAEKSHAEQVIEDTIRVAGLRLDGKGREVWS